MRGPRGEPRDPKVRHLHLTGLRQKDVRRLYVAVDHRGVVCNIQGSAHLVRDLTGFVDA